MTHSRTSRSRTCDGERTLAARAQRAGQHDDGDDEQQRTARSNATTTATIGIHTAIDHPTIAAANDPRAIAIAARVAQHA